MLTEICVDAVLAVKSADEKVPLDLHMVELMDMQHRSEQVTDCNLTFDYRGYWLLVVPWDNYYIYGSIC